MELKGKSTASRTGLKAGITFGAFAAKKSVRAGLALKGFAVKGFASPNRRSVRPSNYEMALAMVNAYPTLWKAVRADLRERGVDRGAVIAELERLLIASRESGREDDEDAVTGVLDSVEGFAPAHSRL